MLTIILIIILAISFYTGYRRGLALQAIRFLGYVITFILATQLFEPLMYYAEMLIPFPSIQPNSDLILYDEGMSFLIDSAFYRVITFLLIAIIGWLITNFLSMFFNRLMYYEWLDSVNAIGGGILNLITSYVITFILLFVLSLLPIEFIQQQFVDNPLAYHMVANTPFLSDYALEQWFKVQP